MFTVQPPTKEGVQNERHHRVPSKVLFVASVYTHLAAFHIPFMKLLREKGYQVHAAACSGDGRREDVERAGVTCWEVPFARSPYSPANVQAFRQLKALLEEHHYDLIHVHTPAAAFIGRLLAKTTHQGMVLYTAHGFHFYRGAPRRNWLVYYTAERIAARWTDGLIVMNHEDLQNAQRLGFKAGENLFYVHGVGVDLEHYSAPPIDRYAIRTHLGINPNDVLVVCVAEFTKQKNHAFFLDAWHRFTRRCTDGHLLLVGAGRESDALRQRVEQECLPRVHFLGYRRDVPQILREADIAALVSKREGLPKCIMEAMAAGKPVLATNVRGSRDLVANGQTGFLVEPGNVDCLVAAMERLVSDPQLRAVMGAAGQEKIQAYKLERVLTEMAAVYDQYLGQGASRLSAVRRGAKTALNR